ncbi:MAG TPA: hypothetical protein VFD26_01035 [Methyloceanibacter sp.]|nr:hypothetical protein [Methyloceanibacter sp.]
MDETERENEISQIEHDLGNLQRRYAILHRSARRMRISSYFLIVALVGFIVAGIVTGNLAALVASTAFLMTAILSALVTLYVFPKVRWIDLAGWSPEGIWGVSIWRTEAMAVEDMVAERVERLASLKGNDK